MTVTPAGILSKPLEALRKAVSESLAFQAWVGTSSDPDALARVHVLSADGDFPDTPFAVVDFGEYKRERVSIKDGIPFEQMDPSESLLYFRDQVVAGIDSLDASYDFCNNVGAVLGDLEKFAGDRLNGYPAIIQIEMIAAPTRIRFEERDNDGDFFEATFIIRWSRQP